MKITMLVAAAALASAALAAPVLAQPVERVTTVYTADLNGFIGRNLFGMAHANLGVVSAADPYAGVVGITGPHGEYALISASMLVHDGVTLHAPTLSAGDIKVASEANFAHRGSVLAGPHVIVVEPSAG
jgi:hypothetical protein